jgi:membrane protease YdiL (CAAX protease family)
MANSPPEKARERAGFGAALGVGWIVLTTAGILYARWKGIPGWAAWPLLAAFLVEYPFYLVPAFPGLRARVAGPHFPAYVFVSAVLPYLICCAGPAQFQWSGLARIGALALALSLWYIVLPVAPVVDLVFLILLPAVLLGRYFDAVFPAAYEGLARELAFLGHFILIQMSVIVLMAGRRVHETGYGFLPTAREWRIGALHYLGFVVTCLPVALLMHAVRWHTPPPIWSIVGTFLGFLWVVGLSEEFFFRGVLQQWIEDWTRRRTLALLVTSVLFGAVHLWFTRFPFPNWRWAIIGTLLGFWCGRARNQAGGIRAGVVTHALVVATSRAFLS